MKNTYLILACCATFLLSCAENPSPVVDSFGGFTSVADLEPSDSIRVNAAVFKGTDFFGQSCNLSLSVVEENGENVFLAKMDYVLHGLTLPSLRANLYRFDLGSNSYNDADTGAGNVTFGGAVLKERATADLNALETYEANGDLIYSLRIETAAASATDYAFALEQVIDDPTQLAAFSSTLDQITQIIFKLAHAGHYDAAGCVGLKLSNVIEQEIKI
jgi:hypothetical protein